MQRFAIVAMMEDTFFVWRDGTWNNFCGDWKTTVGYAERFDLSAARSIMRNFARVWPNSCAFLLPVSA